MKRPFEIWILILLLIILSLNALYGGVGFILKPDGSLMGINTTWLEDSPFSNFLFPGILLILFLGILPAIALIGIFSKKRIRLFDTLNCFPEKHWGWIYAIFSGIGANIWIIVQQLITGYFFFAASNCSSWHAHFNYQSSAPGSKIFYNRNKSYSVIKLIRRHDKF